MRRIFQQGFILLLLFLFFFLSCFLVLYLSVCVVYFFHIPFFFFFFFFPNLVGGGAGKRYNRTQCTLLAQTVKHKRSSRYCVTVDRVQPTADIRMENCAVNISYGESYKRYRRNNHNNNNVNLTGSEFRTISLGIHSELAKLRASSLETPDRRVKRLPQTPFQKETALDIARQITNLLSEPLFVVVGNNGCDMCVNVDIIIIIIIIITLFAQRTQRNKQ